MSVADDEFTIEEAQTLISFYANKAAAWKHDYSGYRTSDLVDIAKQMLRWASFIEAQEKGGAREPKTISGLMSTVLHATDAEGRTVIIPPQGIVIQQVV